MKVLLLLALTAEALALPTPEEATRILGSTKASERAELTAELWDSGRKSLPLLEVLAESDDPEVSQRATFIFRRLRMGLQPDSPAELLTLAGEVEVAKPKDRILRVNELLEHDLGVPVALAFLDLWAFENLLDLKSYRICARVVTASLIEQRSYWREFLTQPLTVRCRSAIIAALDATDDLSLHIKYFMIEKLASSETPEIFNNLKADGEELNSSSYENLARAALIGQESQTALEILFVALPRATEETVVRRIAFLEQLSGLPAIDYQGPWDNELAMLRLRASKSHEELAQLNSRSPSDSLLTYENSLLLGDIIIPSQELPVDDLARSLTAATRPFFAEPPREPDIEDLASTITNESGRLARGLLALGHPVEAAQILSDRHLPDLAVRTLWMSGHQDKARTLADDVMTNGDFKARISIRLVLIQLLGLANLPEEARALFTPLFEQEIKFDDLRRDAVRLALLLYPREKALELVPEINGESPYRRQIAISMLLPYPPKVAIYCYEEMRECHPELQPFQVLAKVEQHLSQDRSKLLEHYQSELAMIKKPSLKYTDPVFELALFLKAPGAIEMLKNSAWNRLSTDDLETVIADESWDLPSRNSALAIALEIAPGSATIRNFNLNLSQQGDHHAIALLTLGDCSEVNQLARWNPDTPALLLAAELADLNQPSSLRCLHLASEKATPRDSIRFFQAALHGELVLGTQPGTPYGQMMTSLGNYFQNQISEARSPESQKIWEERKVSAARQ